MLLCLMRVCTFIARHFEYVSESGFFRIPSLFLALCLHWISCFYRFVFFFKKHLIRHYHQTVTQCYTCLSFPFLLNSFEINREKKIIERHRSSYNKKYRSYRKWYVWCYIFCTHVFGFYNLVVAYLTTVNAVSDETFAVRSEIDKA